MHRFVIASLLIGLKRTNSPNFRGRSRTLPSAWIGLVSRMTSLPILHRIEQRLKDVKVGRFGEMEIKSGSLGALAILGLTPAG